MTCPRHDELSAYADLVMKPGERARFDQHLQACPICQLQLEDLQVLRQGLRALPSPTLGFDLASRLEDRLRHQAQRRHRPWPAVAVPRANMVRVFDPVPPGGLCAAAELCRLSKGMS